MENKNNGWIRLHRKIREHWIWDDPVYLKAWLAILIQVNHADTKVLIKGALMDCKRGQSLLSLESWTKVVGKRWTKKKIRHFFDLLKMEKMILTENMDQKTTRLTVCNYDKYQITGHTEGTTEATLRAHSGYPNNNDNNDNNEKKGEVFFKKNAEEKKPRLIMP